MELKLIRGPLDVRWLGAIAGLYGEFNRKYRDPGFCRDLFNGNPYGYSLHAFVVDGEGEAVGHYAVVPLDVVREGQRRRAGKGEAFVVRPDRRADSVAVGGAEPIAIGMAMPLHLYRYALDQGMELVHMIASQEVGLIHRMTGCRRLEVHQVRATVAALPFGYPSGAPSGGARAAHALLAFGQWGVSGLADLATFAWLGPVRHRSGAALDGRLLARIVQDLPAVDGWTLAVDPSVLAWMAKTGDLQFLALDRGFDDYVVCAGRAGDGRALEVALWRQRSPGPRAALRLLAAVANRARRLGAPMAAVPLAAAGCEEERMRLRAAARLLCFRERAQTAGMYVFTADGYYLDPGHLRFTPFFYATF